MARLVSFNNVTLDGCFADRDGGIQWTVRSRSAPEFDAFVEENARTGGRLVFGRITYELMASYWPTPIASREDPAVAERMNAMPKVVFSRTLTRVSWSNTTLERADLEATVRRMKNDGGPDVAILGSGSVVSQLARAGLIDEFQIVVNPVILGAGRPLFDGITKPLPLELVKSRAFANGNVLLCYSPSPR